MKLKKSVKVVLVFVLLGILGGSFYSFNRYFFTKYKTLGKQVQQEEKKDSYVSNENESMDSVFNGSNEFDNASSSLTNNEKDIDNQKINAESKQNVKKIINAIEEYYCSDNDTLDEKECIHILEKGTMVVVGPPKLDPYTHEVIEEGKKGIPFCMDDEYVLQDDKCIKEEKIPAKVRYVCPEGYFLDGINCKEK